MPPVCPCKPLVGWPKLSLAFAMKNKFAALYLTSGLRDNYYHEFRLMRRVAVDGKEGNIPLETRARIVCALR